MGSDLEAIKKVIEAMEKKEQEKPYVICRTYSAGVFAGYLETESEDGKRVTLINARRIYMWAGAASLSELAMLGTAKPNDCKFPMAVEEVCLTEVIEKLKVTEAAKKSIEGVAVWTLHK